MVGMKAVTRLSGTTVLPCVRGMLLVDLRQDDRRRSAAASGASQDVPERAEAVPIRRGEWQDRHVEGDLAGGEQAGMSDRNTGTKSARPSATAWRSGGPVNRDTARKGPHPGGDVGGRPRRCAGGRCGRPPGRSGGQGLDQRVGGGRGAVQEHSHAAADGRHRLGR